MDVSYTLLALVEGLTEFLPISSTAHLIVLGKMLAINLADPYVKFYLLFIQLGALGAGALLFAKRILTNWQTFLNICASFVPTAILGFILYKMFKHLLEGNMLLLATMLALGGVVFIYLDRLIARRSVEGDEGRDIITLRDAVYIGIAQALAMVPGVSRSGITIIAGVLRGLKKSVVIDYTFVLALPTLGVAVLYDAYKSREMLAEVTSYSELMGGFLVAGVVGFGTLLLLKKYLPAIPLAYFGWYRIVLAVMILAVIF